MFSLYWKVFFAFWLTSLILGGAAVFLSSELREKRSLELPGLDPVKLVERSAFIVRRLPDDISEWQQQLAENDIQFYAAYEDKSPLSTPNYPQAIQQLLDELTATTYIEQSSFTRLLVGRREISVNGEQIRFVIDMPGINVFKAKEWISQIGVQFMLALILSGIVCYVLARYLTRNLEQLSIATRALASGDLSSRAKMSNLSRNDELSQLGHDFNEMATALESSIENQKRLVRDISHELRSPLTRLQIALELARQKANIDELDRIEQEANRLNELIGQILTIPDDSAPLNDIIDLTALLESIIDDCKIEAEVKQVQLLLVSDCDEALVAATATQLHSAIENIIRNAIHYTKDGSSVTIELVHTTAALTKSARGPVFTLLITDCGPGVPEADLSFIFQPFYRVDRARNRNTGGYGIGLAIVQRVIARHKGSVSALNARNGLCVKVQLPEFVELTNHN